MATNALINEAKATAAPSTVTATPVATPESTGIQLAPRFPEFDFDGMLNSLPALTLEERAPRFKASVDAHWRELGKLLYAEHYQKAFLTEVETRIPNSNFPELFLAVRDLPVRYIALKIWDDYLQTNRISSVAVIAHLIIRDRIMTDSMYNTVIGCYWIHPYLRAMLSNWF